MNDAARVSFESIQNELVPGDCAFELLVAPIHQGTLAESNLTIQQLPSRIKDQALFRGGFQPCSKRRLRLQSHAALNVMRRIAHNALDLSLGVPKDPLARFNSASTSQRLFPGWRKFLMPSVFNTSTREQNLHSRAIPVALSPSIRVPRRWHSEKR